MIFEILMCGMESGAIDERRNSYRAWELSNGAVFHRV